jgi:hypothetical protein
VTTPCIVLGGESLFWQLGAFLTVELIRNEKEMKPGSGILVFSYKLILS